MIASGIWMIVALLAVQMMWQDRGAIFGIVSGAAAVTSITLAVEAAFR